MAPLVVVELFKAEKLVLQVASSPKGLSLLSNQKWPSQAAIRMYWWWSPPTISSSTIRPQEADCIGLRLGESLHKERCVLTEMQNPATIVAEYDENKKDFEAGCWNREEVE